MKIKIIDAKEIGVGRTYSNGDVVEVEYNFVNDEYIDMEEPFVYLAEWDGKYFEVIEEIPSEWPGESLPSVGTVCEVSINNQEYREVEIVAYFDKTRSVVIYQSPWTPEIYEWDDCKFRPIQSEKDKEIEKLTIYIDDFGNGSASPETLAEYLYNQGYRKTK